MFMQREDPKDIVKAGYDGMAQAYLDFAQREPSSRLEWTDKLVKDLPNGSAILELGCGGGLPVTKYLLEQGSTVTANDISQTQIDVALREVPGAKYVVGDMMSLEFPHSTFDGVVMFFSLFHLPLQEQPPMLCRIWLWLKPDGYLVLSVGAEREPEHRGDFVGKAMFWANAGTEGTIKMIQEAGFEVVESEVKEEKGSAGEENPDEGVSFLWVLARKKHPL